jgi:hypothetical protein
VVSPETLASRLILPALAESPEYQVEGSRRVTIERRELLIIPEGAVRSAKNVGRGNGAERRVVAAMTPRRGHIPRYNCLPSRRVLPSGERATRRLAEIGAALSRLHAALRVTS